jgi:hypothetical protein
MKQINMLYSEYLKSQMNPKKNIRSDRMDEEEYRLNREILEEIKYSPGKSVSKGFLI